MEKPTRLLGLLEVSLFGAAQGGESSTTTLLRSHPETLSADVPLVIGSLLFIESQIRLISEVQRLGLVNLLTALADRPAAESINLPGAPVSGRLLAVFEIQVLASDGFQETTRSRVIDFSRDMAGELAAAGLARELLGKLSEPYRTFFRQMIAAPLPFWGERRPSILDQSWNWPASLQWMNTLMARHGDRRVDLVEPCPACKAPRPVGASCLRCGAPSEAISSSQPGPVVAALPPVPSVLAVPVWTPVAADPVIVPTREAPPPPPPVEVPPPADLDSAPLAPEPPESAARDASPRLSEPVVVAAPVVPPRPDVSVPTPRPTLVAATPDDTPDVPVPEEPDEAHWPLAGLIRRGLAFVVDWAFVLALAAIGSFGIIGISVWLSGGVMGIGTRSTLATIGTSAVVILYYIVGWASGETIGGLIFRIRLADEVTRQAPGVGRALRRVFAVAILVGVAAIIFFVGQSIDDRLTFIQGFADTIVRIGVTLVALAFIAQAYLQILLNPRRQIWPDHAAGTVALIPQPKRA